MRRLISDLLLLEQLQPALLPKPSFQTTLQSRVKDALFCPTSKEEVRLLHQCFHCFTEALVSENTPTVHVRLVHEHLNRRRRYLPLELLSVGTFFQEQLRVL